MLLTVMALTKFHSLGFWRINEFFHYFSTVRKGLNFFSYDFFKLRLMGFKLHFHSGMLLWTLCLVLYGLLLPYVAQEITLRLA